MGVYKEAVNKIRMNSFLLSELVKRDFKKKYKRTILGVGWSVLSPLMMLLVMRVVFTRFFGNDMEHYTTYLFCGILVFNFFNDSTNQGMFSLIENAGVITKINVPKWVFLLSKNIQVLINFAITLVVFFLFCLIDHITFTWRFVFLIYGIACILIFNFGAGLILSAMFVFFRDTQYLWNIFTQILMYMSAIFYPVDTFGPRTQMLFKMNPVFLYINYFRRVVMYAEIPSLRYHGAMLAVSILFVLVGYGIYRKCNHEFLYYM